MRPAGEIEVISVNFTCNLRLLTPSNDPEERTVDMLVGMFDLSERRKFEVKGPMVLIGMTLYFKVITRADRKRAQSLANSDQAFDISTQMLCQMAEREDGSKAFVSADVPKLQRELPEKILNELELFCSTLRKKRSMNQKRPK